jgi:hypothetical protein
MNTSQREALAQRVKDNFGVVAAKLSELEVDIRALWVEFEQLEHGEEIMGCITKAQFCRRVLHRTPRAVQYMLAGGNRSEKLSLLNGPLPMPDVVPFEVRRDKFFGKDCIERNTAVIRELSEHLKKTAGLEVKDFKWSPFTSDPDKHLGDGCGNGINEDRYHLTLVVSKDDVQKIAAAFVPTEATPRKELRRLIVEDLDTPNFQTRISRLHRFVTSLARDLGLSFRTIQVVAGAVPEQLACQTQNNP